MFRPGDLTPRELRVALAGLCDTHWRRVEVHLLELDTGKHISDLSDRLLDGDVTYDITADVTRTLDLRLVDTHRGNLGFDPVDASRSPVHRSKALHVIDSRFIPALGAWVDWPVFWGPVWDFARDGAEIMVTGHSLERQALGSVWQTFSFKAHKAKTTDCIRRLLAAVGDINAAVPDLPHTIPHDLVLHSTDQVWPHVKELAASIDHHVFYSGAGRFVMRSYNQKPVYHFHRSLLGPVKPTRGTIAHNVWLVLGPNPKGPKPRPRGVATLGGSSSPAGLSRHGVPHRLVQKIERQHLKTNADAQKIANRLAREHGVVHTGLAFDSLPLPHLEEYDMVGVEDATMGTTRVRMRQWNLPLGGGPSGGSTGQPTTVGTNRRTTRAKVRHR